MAQKDLVAPASPERVMVKDNDEEVFTVVEEMPVFPGAEKAMFEYFGNNIKYPKEAIEAGIQGTVYVTFVVGSDGALSDARVLRGIGGGCDEEALRVVKAMPNWVPGKQREKPVSVQYNLPIRFVYREEDKKGLEQK